MSDQVSRLPSVFELLASDKLKDSLREAFRYLLNNLRKHGNIKGLPPSDETVLLLDLFIEFSYLRAYRASYAENLYNLIRYSRSSNAQITHTLPSLICLTIAPYLRKKLDKYFEELNYKETRTADELRQIRMYRLFTRSASFINLLCMLRFAAGQSNYHNFMNCITGISLNCRTMTIQGNLTDGGISTFDSANFSKIVADSMGRALTIGSYVIQFLDFWNTHSNSTPLFSASLPIPKPPPKFIQQKGGNNAVINDDEEDGARSVTNIGVPYTDEKSSSICLICEHVRQNECALSNTGYVFCYSCIYKYVKTKQRCPITGNPATDSNIVKLYQDNDAIHYT